MTDREPQHTYSEAERLAESGAWAEAEKRFVEAGEAGDPRGWLALARHYSEDAHRDHARAAAHFERAAGLGSADGALQAAYHYWTGSAGEKDPKRALRYFEQAADAGGCISATRAGMIHYSGEAGTADPERAVDLFKRAIAIDEEPEAMLGLARAFSEGKISRDTAAAVHWYRRATLEAETLGDRASTDARRAMFAEWAAEGARGVRALLGGLTEQAEAGDAASCFELSQMHQQRFIDEADEDAGFRWLERAADREHGEALLQLAHRYRTGDGVALDAKKARAFLVRAAATDLSAAHHDLAYALLSGLGGKVDVATAIDHYRNAARQGRRNSMYDLAVQLDERGSAGDAAECTEWLRVAAERSDIASMQWLAQRYRDGEGAGVDYIEATRWFFRPLVFGNGDGVHEIHAYLQRMSADDVREAARRADVASTWADSLIAKLKR